MKKAVLISEILLIILIILLPLGVVISYCFGYIFELADYILFSAVTAVFSVGVVILCLLAKKRGCSISSVLIAMPAPLSIVNAAVYILKCFNIWVILSVFVCACCCFCLTAICAKPMILKVIALILSALMMLPVFLYGNTAGLIALIFGDMVQNTVVKSVESPSGSYYAEIIDSNQGALGGDTLVYVYENKGIDNFAFRTYKKPQMLYQGDWGEFKYMNIYWKDDNCLIINAVEYKIG